MRGERIEVNSFLLYCAPHSSSWEFSLIAGMAATTNHNFWQPDLAQNFQEAIQTISKLTDTPCPEQQFDLPAEIRSRHVLRLKDELLLSSHVAVLAHNVEDPIAISAVAIEEQKNGLIFRLASNENPKKAVITGLRGILNVVANFSPQGSRRKFNDEDAFKLTSCNRWPSNNCHRIV